MHDMLKYAARNLADELSVEYDESLNASETSYFIGYWLYVAGRPCLPEIDMLEGWLTAQRELTASDVRKD